PNQCVRFLYIFPECRVHGVQPRKTTVQITDTRIERQSHVFRTGYLYRLGEESTRFGQLLYRQTFVADVQPRSSAEPFKTHMSAPPEHGWRTVHAYPLPPADHRNLPTHVHQTCRRVHDCA